MRKRYVAIFICLALLLVYFLLMQDFQKTESSIFYNGTILTMEAPSNTPEAIFVERGIIKSIGSQEDILNLKTKHTQLVDLDGKTIMPGFIDPHTHPAISTFLYSMVDVSGFKHQTPEALWQHLSHEINRFEKNEWIICKGFDPMLIKGLEAPHIQFLDSIAPQNPLVIIAQSLHSYWANTIAFEQVGISKNTPDPTPTSYYEKDEQGELTGFIAETVALEPFAKKLEEIYSAQQMIDNTAEVLKDYARMGNTTIVTTGLTVQDAKPLRLYEHLSAEKPNLLNQLLAAVGIFPKRLATVRHFLYMRHDRDFLLPPSPNNGDDFYRIIGLKHWYDGSPYTGSMFLSRPYEVSDLTTKGLGIPAGYRGERLLEVEELASFIDDYQSQGWQIAVHVQGDQAIKETLEAFELVDQQSSVASFRHRFEHCLLLQHEDIHRLSKLNITPSIHINHLYYYGEALRDDLIGAKRAEQILPVGDLETAGLTYTLHADQPMFKSDPLHLIQTAVRRQTKERSVIGESQNISIEQALKAMTIDAAWQIHMEDKIGSIKIGKYADFVILDHNPLKVNIDNVRNIKVLQTIVHGNRIEY